MTINYISLFSGIGCFEYAIHSMFPKANCLGFSEINPYAIKVYKEHYPNHNNLGDITKIKEKQLQQLLSTQKCHLIVAGFPCQDLSSLAPIFGHRDKFGLQGEKSKLFFRLKRILKWVWKYSKIKPKVIIENNSSMNQENWYSITNHLVEVDPNFCSIELNGMTFGVQRRNRVFWTNFKVPIPDSSFKNQTWKDILLPYNDTRIVYVSDSHVNNFNKIYKVKSQSSESRIVKKDKKTGWLYFEFTGRVGEKSRWQLGTNHSDTSLDYSLPITRARNFIIIRKKDKQDLFKIRKLHSIELERLFFLPDGYVSLYVSQTQSENLLGNAIIIRMIQYILYFLK